jgi:hypothetical protein
MQKKIFVYIGIAIIAVSIVTGVGLTLNDDEKQQDTFSLPELEFTYDESNLKLKQNLESHEISMSSPLKLTTISNINEFCTFFENEVLQNQVEYCTSTELLDSEGNYLGNIHMVGNSRTPKIVLVVIQADPFWENLDSVKTVYSTVVEDLVCDCWNEIQPSDIQTVADWVDKQRDFHTSDTKPTSKSNLDLAGMQLQMELTTNTEGYLWKLLISG